MAGTYVSAPPAVARPHGLLTQAAVLDAGTEHEFYGGTEHEPEVCGIAHSVPDACFDLFVTLDYETETGVDEDTLTITLTNFDPDITYEASIDGGAGEEFTDGVLAVTVTSTDPEAPHNIVITTDAGAFVWSFTVDYPVAESGVLYVGTAKGFEGYGTVHGTPFVLYKGVECFMDDPQSNVDRAARALELSEGRGIEAQFWNVNLAGSALDLTPTPGTAIDIATGIGILEQAAGSTYPAQPTIHLGLRAGVVARAQKVIFGNGEDVTTIAGTPVVLGSGYISVHGPGGEQADVGEAWVYITGPVAVRRSTMFVSEVMDHSVNTKRALAERKYIVTYDCIAYAVLVDISNT